MMVVFSDLPTVAFPLEDYPRFQNGSFDEGQISFFKTISDASGNDYWSSPHQIALVNLPNYVQYIEKLRRGEIAQQKYIPNKAPYVYYNEETLEL